MKPTKFQSKVQETVKQGNSLLLIAPTGLGKTFAVTGDIQEKFCKTVYSVPLRGLGSGIQEAISEFKRNSKPIQPVIHHGDLQESMLFSEEVIVTTYDQIVCGIPGLPLSLPLKAGHAVAGALLMSRLILDEVHLAWGISDQALAILLAIIDFRQKLGLQTIVLTATLPTDVAELVSEKLGLELIVVGANQTADDEGLKLREDNRKVKIASIDLKGAKKKKGNDGESKQLDYTTLDNKLKYQGKRIYFANTVERLQETFDRLIAKGVDSAKILMLHNRMPKSQRAVVEKQVMERFGKNSGDSDWLLLTNQVAEAGLDISAPLVVSDPAPVDTLVQRAGRCARWFRDGKTKGEFCVIKVPKAQRKEWVIPYREGAVDVTLKDMPSNAMLSWADERNWVDNAWGLQKQPKNRLKERKEQIENKLTQTTFALNLFDRAAQNQKPGEIASAFREIVSVEVAVENIDSTRNLQELLDSGKRPETSSISLDRAQQLLRESKGKARIIRYEEGNLQVLPATYVQTGDVLIVPSTVAYLHKAKGLCFRKDSSQNGNDEILNSEWIEISKKESHSFSRNGGHRQSLLEYAVGVMEGTYKKLKDDGAYHRALINILSSLEPEKDAEQLVNVIAQIAALAAAFHDIGKADQRWQAKAHEFDPECPVGMLVGRSGKTGTRIGIPHTPPGYFATLKTCRLLLGNLGSSEHLIRAIALAAARHHSALLNPANVDYAFEPHVETSNFVRKVLAKIGAPMEHAQEIIEAAKRTPSARDIPLLLPNDDLFPIYALVGRAILMADREDAAGETLEQWEASL